MLLYGEGDSLLADVAYAGRYQISHTGLILGMPICCTAVELSHHTLLLYRSFNGPGLCRNRTDSDT